MRMERREKSEATAEMSDIGESRLYKCDSTVMQGKGEG